MTYIFIQKYFIINYILNFMYRIFNEKSIYKILSLREIYNNKTKVKIL